MAKPKRNLLDKDILLGYLSERTVTDEATGCIVWQRSTTQGGYALIRAPWGRMIGVHRLVYIVCVAALTDDMEVHHICGNRRCVNPSHLQALTDMEHRRADANSMVSRTHCKRGHPLDGDNLSPSRLKAGKRICKVCATIRAKHHRQRNPEKARAYIRAYMKQWRAEHPERTRELLRASVARKKARDAII